MSFIYDLMWLSIGSFQRVNHRPVMMLNPCPNTKWCVYVCVFFPQLVKRTLFLMKQRQTLLLQFSKFTEKNPIDTYCYRFCFFVCFIPSILTLEYYIYLGFSPYYWEQKTHQPLKRNQMPNKIPPSRKTSMDTIFQIYKIFNNWESVNKLTFI